MTPLAFETARCRVEPLRDGDAAAVTRLYLDPEVRRYLGGPVPEPQARGMAEALRDDHPDSVVRAVRVGEGAVGLIFVSRYHEGTDAELSYMLAPEIWGRGIATEVLAAAIPAVFAARPLPRLVAETQAANAASRRVLEKVGMREVRRLTRFEAAQVLYAVERDA